ncbi:MAG TPA: serine/threonine-protein kinase [Vicinamibacterales bacterium]|nr:serine/threonine-protein kinase [Vicinamibacterales bacterium]
MRCPACTAENPPDNQFCGACGQAISPLSQRVTATGAAPAQVAAVGVGRIISSDSVPVGGLTPGTVLSDRYRIIGLLGRGGMGEVYRADDLKLGQPVALKFLPPELADDPVRRERFFAEVRITRQLAHPNICRVYDIAEWNGAHFLSMEFIDGEDLASLLKRIGHLSSEKAIDIARQLVAGLATAHERGVLHRDLKPSNVMIDGRGRVRITDFGLAIATTDEAQLVGDVSGTPAYMAPEQLAGKGASVRSDLYALGLVLYEILSGKRAFKAATIAELRHEKEQSTPRAPSEFRSGIDPIVERLVMRCLERDPRARPSSVAQLAAALPGGDPLAAAIAAGETPSPELVAASGLKEGLRPAHAVAWLTCTIAGAVAAIAMNPAVMMFAKVKLDKPPAVLVERAHQILDRLGHTAGRADSAFGFTADQDVLRYVLAEAGGRRWTHAASSAVVFWYRQSPRSLERSAFVPALMFSYGVTADDPPLRFPGEALVRLDTQGNLRSLEAIASPSAATPPGREADWRQLFTESGLDSAKWTASSPQRTPLFFGDVQAAWQGFLTGAPEVPARLEAAAYHGSLVSARLVGPWTPSVESVASRRLPETVGFTLFLVTLTAITTAGIYFAHRNLRLGRGDRRGATRLLAVIAVLSAVSWVLSEHHVAGFWEALLLVMFVSWTMFLTGFAWVLYIALEPFVRRRWPHVLVSWTRALAGDLRDPLVGRDVLVGCTAGVALACLVRGAVQMYLVLDLPVDLPVSFGFETFAGTSTFLAVLVELLRTEILGGLIFLFLLFFLHSLLRNWWVAAIAFVFVLALPDTLTIPTRSLWFVGGVGLIFYAVFLFALWRFGLVALILALFTYQVFMRYPMTFDAANWYAGIGFAALVVVGAIAVYGFWTSLGDRSLLAAAADD